MFVGHYAVALASKKAAPGMSLGTLFLSAQFVDLLWPLFLLLGLEHVRIDPGNTAFTPLDFYDYPITHSLVGSIAWSLVLALRLQTHLPLLSPGMPPGSLFSGHTGLTGIGAPSRAPSDGTMNADAGPNPLRYWRHLVAVVQRMCGGKRVMFR